MSFFDAISGFASNIFGSAIEDRLPGLLQGALGHTEFGNFSGLIDHLRQAGLDEQVSSWLSNGPNLPISPDQIASALGAGTIADLAGQVGLSPDIVTNALSNYLPGIVDKLSKNGVLDQG